MKKNETLKYILKTILFFIVFFVLWGILGEIDYKRCQEKKEPLLTLNAITTQYDNGTITEYVCIGYKVVEYQLENKKDVWEYVSSVEPIDTANLVDKYLKEKNQNTIDDENTNNVKNNSVNNNIVNETTENVINEDSLILNIQSNNIDENLILF